MAEKTKTLKVKQVAVTSLKDNAFVVCAVAEDGSVWQLGSKDDEWIELPAIEVVEENGDGEEE